MATEHLDPATEQLWQDFHAVVNMTGDELRTWLLTDASGPGEFGPEPSMGIPETGRHVVRILNKRRVDLTNDDLDTMREVVDSVRALLGDPGPHDDEWRRRLMRLGHDPLRPEPDSPEERPEPGPPELGPPGG